MTSDTIICGSCGERVKVWPGERPHCYACDATCVCAAGPLPVSPSRCPIHRPRTESES